MASSLGKLSEQLNDAQKALKAIDGEITTVKIDPTDPTSIERAVREMRSAVDRKLSPYRNNPFVKPIVESSKEAFEKRIRQRAASLKV